MTELRNTKGPQCPFCKRTLDPVEYEAFQDLDSIECGWCEHRFKVTYRRQDIWYTADRL